MLENEGFADIGRFVLELTATGGAECDIDRLLERLLGLLQKSPSFRIRPVGFIGMRSRRGRLIAIAQHGLQPIWLDSSADILLAKVPRTADNAAFTASLKPAGNALVLPLTLGSRQVGLAVVFIDPDWTPSDTDMEFMTNLAQVFSGLVNNRLLSETLQVRDLELDEAGTQALRRLGTAAEFRDQETGMHIMRMTNIAVVIAKALGLSDLERELLCITAPMHDVGKIGIGDDILLKPGSLTKEEFEAMKKHTEIGERLLQGSDSLMKTARDIAISHHESWDGNGYPHRLKGEEIPILGRICSVADVFDALTSSRPYKEAWTVEVAASWIVDQSGKKFDPAVVSAFTCALPEILRIRELYREDIIDPNQVLDLKELINRDTRWISWDASFSVGIDVIDEHHRYLFDLTNDLIDVVANKLGAREVLRLLKALGQYAQVHFHAEERMMEHYHFEGLERQKIQHRQFNDKLHEFCEELHDHPLVTQFEVLPYLREWLVGHIRHEDTQLRALVVKQGSDENTP